MSSTSDRVALVTGASRGMGAHVARRLGEDGFSVALADVRDCEEAARAVRDLGREARAFSCDIADWDAVGELVESVGAELGPLEATVQVAGIYRIVPFLEMDPRSWRELMDVNLDGTFNVVRHAAAEMAPRGSGSIVVISSTASWLAWDDSTHYTTSKAAIVGLMRGAAYELGRYGVRVNAVAPGTIRTPGTAEELAMPGVEASEARACPLGRVGETADVAEAVAFLCDARRSAWITGHQLVVDGGYSTHGEASGFGQHTDTTLDSGA
ncbi:MAG: SDR family oxidoreductase [Thermoleophilaceae bacterium]|nr:SDR family oxidoreductase [Thermoleophilaceae bacterium]